MHLWKEADLRECATQAYFEKHGITPLTLVYEDFIRDYEATIRRIIDFLGIDHKELIVAPMHYERTADEQSSNGCSSSGWTCNEI